MVTAAFGALALGDFDEAASVSFLFSISEWLEAQATGKARRALGEIVSLRPEYAHVIDEQSGQIKIVPAENVPLGSLCSVRTGDKVPADGFVIEGSSSVDESSITGEARPVDKVSGNEICAGAINVGSTQLLIKTTSTVGDSTLSRLIALVEEAQTNSSETEKLVDAFAKRYTPIVLATALLVCTVPWVFGVETGRHWALNGLIIIVIACPCALTISTPVTYSAGLAATAKRGIIIKGGSRLEVSTQKVIPIHDTFCNFTNCLCLLRIFHRLWVTVRPSYSTRQGL
jgi:Cd2+/Zn2+-exporting ATPase